MDLLSGKWRKPKSRGSVKQKQKAKSAVTSRWKDKPNLAGGSTPQQTEQPDQPPDNSDILQPPQEAQPAEEAYEPGTASRKLNYFKEGESEASDRKEDFYFVHSSTVQQLIKDWKCSICKSSLEIDERDSKGFAKTIQAKCTQCGNIEGLASTSPRVKDKFSQRPPFLLNRRMVESFLSIGSGFASMERFGMEMGINIMSSRGWKLHLKRIVEDNENFQNKVLEEACSVVRKEHGASEEEKLDLCVSFDGTWQKRGHVSLNGAAFVIDIMTGLVVDYVILSKHCQACSLRLSYMEENSPKFLSWKQEHVEFGECQINYQGSSGGMETHAAEILWRRSEKRNMRYLTMLADGDAKTHKHLNSLQIYGPVEIKKEECINHVAKRMTTGLKNLVDEWKIKKVKLGGKGVGTLKEGNILKLTSYYRKAIVQNMPDVQAMQDAIWATVDHCSSTDVKPNHAKCPQGESSWCFYNSAISKNEEPPSHSSMGLILNATVAEKVRPLYQRLSSEVLLERCSRGGTQNSNESLHACLWSICPKDVFISRATLEVGAARAVAEFNMGYSHTLSLRHVIAGEDIAGTSSGLAQRKDLRKRKRSDEQEATTQKRFQKKQERRSKASSSKNKANNEKMYKAGGF